MRLFILALVFLISCQRESRSPLDNFENYSGNVQDFLQASGQFYAVRYFYANGVIDTVRVVVKDGIITGISQNGGPTFKVYFPLNPQGISIKKEGGSQHKIFADYTDNANSMSAIQPNNSYNENDDRDYEGSIAQTEDLLKEQAETDKKLKEIQSTSQNSQANNYAPTRQQEFYYKIECHPNFGVTSLKCQKSDNSIGESCQEIGSLKGYGQCIGAFVWHQGNKIGGVMWTKNKIAYEAWEGEYNSGSWIIYEIPSNKIGIEEITFCTPKGNQMEIHTTSGIIYR